MKFYTEYICSFADLVGQRKKIDNTIYTFDIETTSYIILNNKVYPAIEYQNLTKEEQEQCEFRSCMYEWTFSINDDVYYGRTWEQLEIFIDKIEYFNPHRKILFIHNLAFEFQYLKSIFDFEDVMARKSHKVMRAFFSNYNFELRCTYFMSNCKLEKLPEVFKLDVTKKVGDLDYSKIRTPATKLTKKELGYCESDCLVVYKYIKREIETYKRVDKIPLTSTGHVRRELKELVEKDYDYKDRVYKAINTNPHVYNLLQDAFMGGYTHANWIYADEILENIDSWDFTSSYPYVLVTHKYPATEFKKCNIKNVKQMSNRFAYLLVVRFKNIKSKYYNNFISASKCRNIKGARYDNGRIMYADSFEITLTDVDFRFILESHTYEEYEIIESYFSLYDYLPKTFIEFVLKKYVIKTQYKDVKGKELEYMLEKNKYNALYGMSVTNTIRDEVTYDNIEGWNERPLTNEEIIEGLQAEKKKSFLSFAYGVWVTAYARNNLLKNVIKLDKFVVYCDTDSIKLLQGYDINIIKEYNNFVKKKIEFVANKFKISVEKFAPKDVKGKEHMLGLFDNDAHYDKFITQGAKKYAVEQKGEIKITVAGVPKSGAKALKRLEDFRDDFVFRFKDTNKNLIIYVDNQEPIEITDYQGNKYIVNDKSGCCLVPTTYILGKAEEYANLITDESSKRARYQE